MKVFALILGCFIGAPLPVLAQASDTGGPVYYAVREAATIHEAVTFRPIGKLNFREPVQVIGREYGWAKIQKEDGLEGYVDATSLSNIWIRVSKSRQAVWVYRGVELIKRFPADMGHNIVDNKERRGSVDDPDSWRTPEGVFFVTARNPRSRFYKALVLNYPTPEYADRGLSRGLISEREYKAIVSAAEQFKTPPMNTALGGWIEIHGHGTGGNYNWTQGCVALRDVHIDEVWEWAEIGTPVLIEP